MDCKIIIKVLSFLIFFSSSLANSIEFKGKFLQGHYIVGLTDPSAKILIDKKKVKVSKDGYFVFGLDRDRKFDVSIVKFLNEKYKKNKFCKNNFFLFFLAYIFFLYFNNSL